MAQGEKENQPREANAEPPEAKPPQQQQLRDDLHVNKDKQQAQTQLSAQLDTQEKRTDTPKDLDSNSENPVECDPEGYSVANAKAGEPDVVNEPGHQHEDTAQPADASKECVDKLKHRDKDAVPSAAHAGNEQQDAIIEDQPESEAETEVPEDDDEIESTPIQEKSDVEKVGIVSVTQQEQGQSLEEAKPKVMDSSASTQSGTVTISQKSGTPKGSAMDLETIDLTSESVQEHCPSPEKEPKDVEMIMGHSAEQPVSTDGKPIETLAEANIICSESSDQASEIVDEEQRDIEDTAPTPDVATALLDESRMSGAEQAVDDEDEAGSEAETVVPEDDEDLVQANAAELIELAKALDHDETADQEVEKVLDAHEDTGMAEADADSMPEGEQWFGEEDISTEGYAIAIPTVHDDEVLQTSPTKPSGLKRKRPSSESYTGEVVEISSDEEKTSKHSGSNSSSSSSSSGSSSSSSSSSSSGSESSDAESQPPLKRQVPIPMRVKRVARGPARPAISLDDYKIFKDVDPLMRDTPILKGKYAVHKTKYARFTGVWGFSTEDFDHPERVSKFEYTTRKLQGRRENDRRPVSGRYTGYFNFRQFGGKIVRIQESLVELDFRKIRPPESLPSGSDELVEADLSEESSDVESGDAQYVVYGKGKNRFGRFLIHGYLNPADGRLVVRRKYLE